MHGLRNDHAHFSGRLVMGRCRVVYVGPGAVSDRHAHHAVQLVVSADGPFEVVIGDERYITDVALVPAGVPHAFDATRRTVALVLVDRHDVRGARLDALARTPGGTDMARALVGATLPEGSPATVLAAVDAWIDALVGVAPRSVGPTFAVRAALAYLEESVAAGEHPTIAEAAARAKLSPVRLTHRFKDEVGAPFRALVPWYRMARAASLLAGRAPDLTSAAHGAGFVDAAHMSRTFRRAFGLAPSAFFGAAQIVWSTA